MPITIDQTIRGLEMATTLPVAGAATGSYFTRTLIAGTLRGMHSITGLLITGRAGGQHLSRFKITGTAPGWHKLNPAIKITGQLAGWYRAARDELDRYELYVGLNGAVNYSSPVATQAVVYVDGLPTVDPPIDNAVSTPGSGTNTYRFVLRLRNKWNLLSQNVSEWVLSIDSTGAVVPTPPTAPTDVSATASAGRTVTITARYAPDADGSSAADQWLIYYTTNGTTPNPATSSLVVVDMASFAGVCTLSNTTTAQTEGTTVKALVRTRKSGSTNIDSVSSAVVSAVATAVGPAAVRLDGLFGDRALQSQ